MTGLAVVAGSAVVVAAGVVVTVVVGMAAMVGVVAGVVTVPTVAGSAGRKDDRAREPEAHPARPAVPIEIIPARAAANRNRGLEIGTPGRLGIRTG
jgi:hypothetical protein